MSLGDVVQDTIDAVLMGGEPDLEAWRTSMEPFRRINDSGSEEIDALIVLSRVILAEDSSRIPELIESIPERQRYAVTLARTVLAARCLDTSDPDSLSEYVQAVFFLHEYRGARSQPRAVMERLADLQWRALDLRRDALDLQKVPTYIILANALARSFSETKHLDRAYSLIDRLLESSDGGRFLALNNLLTTCELQAQCRPSEEERYIVRGVELATVLFESRGEYEHRQQDVGMLRAVIVNAVQRLIHMNAKLAGLRPEHAAEHAAAAWRYAFSLMQLAGELDDPDVRREAISIQDHLRKTVGLPASLPPDWSIAPTAPAIPENEESLDEYAKGFDAYVTECSTAARAVLGLAPGAAQRDAATEHIRGVYESLERSISLVLREVGMTRHASRLLLALGAIASPRPFQLLESAVHGLVLQGRVPKTGSAWARKHGLVEESPPRAFFEAKVNYAAQIVGLAAYVQELSTQSPDLGQALRAVVRAFNRRLVRNALSALGCPRPLQGKAMSKVDDVVELLAMVERFGGDQRDAGAEQSDEHEERSPFLSRQPTHVELEHSRVMRPEDLVGTTIRMGGKPYQVRSLLGTGTQKAVFGVTHDGHESAIAMSLQAFGPRASLWRYLESVRLGRAQFDDDVVLMMCDEGLAVEPHSPAFGLYKGKVLVRRGDLVGASAAFDLALASAPDDQKCLMHKAVALALLGQHSGAVVHMARTARLDPAVFPSLLKEWGAARGDLAASVQQVLANEPDRSDARHLLAEYFS